MGTWSHLIIEGFCLYESSRKKHIEIFDLKGESLGLRENPCYIDAKRPKHCSNCDVDYDCLKSKCSFFAWVPVEEDEYKCMVEAWESGQGDLNPQ